MGWLVPSVVRIAKLLVIAGFFLSDSAGAQTGVPSPGTRIRVLAPTVLSSRATGILQSLESDSLRFFRFDRGESVVLPTGAVTQLDQSLGTRGHILQGLGIGMGLGLLIGLYAFEDPSEKGLEAIEYGIRGAVVGLLVGGVAGAAIRTERWETVPPGSWRLGFGVGRNLGIRLATNF